MIDEVLRVARDRSERRVAVSGDASAEQRRRMEARLAERAATLRQRRGQTNRTLMISSWTAFSDLIPATTLDKDHQGPRRWPQAWSQLIHPLGV